MGAAHVPPEPPELRPGDEWTPLQAIGFGTLLDRGPVLLAVSSSFDTGVPQGIRQSGPYYMLRVGNGLTPPTPLAFDPTCIHVTLSFGGVPHEVTIPWAAIVVAKTDTVAPVPAPKTRHLKLVEGESE